MKRRDAPKDEPPAVPIWIVSFGDMITNLLACFVMMQALASTQDKTLFGAGMGSFRRAISQYGLPDWLFGKEDKPNLGYQKRKYPTEEQAESPDQVRLIDADAEKIRRLFHELQESLETRTSDARETLVSLRRTEIRFQQFDESLDASARECLERLSANLKENLGAERIKIYIIALAADVPQARRQWILSARRARTVERFLRGRISEELKTGNWETLSWGAGSGGDWSRRMGQDPEQSFVFIAVVKAGD